MVDDARPKTRVTVVTGFLGVGKTSAIRDAFRELRPEAERWAVLVNEFGAVGLDGAVLADAGEVREVRGGCICCTSGPQFRANLVRLLRDLRPDRLLIEPSGLAHPATILDMLRSPGIRESVTVCATVTLVDLRRVREPRIRSSDVWNDQIAVADVLIGTRAHLASPADLDAFDALASGLWPPKKVISVRDGSTLDADPPDPADAWLDLAPSPAREVPIRATHPAEAPAISVHGGVLRATVTGAATSCGWIFPAEWVFDRDRLVAVLQSLAQPSALLPEGILRAKAIFRCNDGWLLFQVEPERVRVSRSGHRADSRFELLTPPRPVDWDAIESAIHTARLETPR